ncbi:hypothetical protein Golax_000656 [Gossypium laxum]|uniref:Uncharacterized protein n=1 Tax=Gossypium laxum TaxID=34288 RepID=A0A7J9AUE3_9ROSI|nr:hypothetical protein [Gossypium laxum]
MLSLTLPLPAWFLLHDILITCLALNVSADSIRCHNRGIVLGPPHPIFLVLMELPMFTVPTDLLYSIFTVSMDLSLFYVYCPNGLISMDAIESFFYGLTSIRHLEVLSYDAIESFIHCLTHHILLTKPSTDTLRIIIPENACILCITTTAGTELASVDSPDTVIPSSPRKEVHDLWAFYLHAALLCQAFADCEKFPIAPSHRSLGRVSIPVWLIILSD